MVVWTSLDRTKHLWILSKSKGEGNLIGTQTIHLSAKMNFKKSWIHQLTNDDWKTLSTDSEMLVLGTFWESISWPRSWPGRSQISKFSPKDCARWGQWYAPKIVEGGWN